MLGGGGCGGEGLGEEAAAVGGFGRLWGLDGLCVRSTAWHGSDGAGLSAGLRGRGWQRGGF